MASSAKMMLLTLCLCILDTALILFSFDNLTGTNVVSRQNLVNALPIILMLTRTAILIHLWVLVLGKERWPRKSRSSAIGKHNTSAREPVSFFGLPLEVRNLVYQSLFAGQDISLRKDDHKSIVEFHKPRFVMPQIRRDRSLGLNILLVSKACLHEAKAALLNEANFYLEFNQLNTLLEDTLRGFSKDDLLRVRSLHCDHEPRWYSSMEHCHPLGTMTRLAKVDVLYAFDMWFDVFDMNMWLDAIDMWPEDDPKEYLQANIISILHDLALAWKPCRHKALLRHFKAQAARRKGMKLVFRVPIPIDGFPIVSEVVKVA
ncbi:hypothetical protein EDD36DRAFT_243730 [Exophiala viscosa]|uniref:F-box domain-containing protein n=1 Tax=Exophiala viscosa TaxID=2486360 RepID=A0AAN6DWF6_9EURO|nr:hypothetical protein EDD36DRAFT_243730 [Exophiala viscosa]